MHIVSFDLRGTAPDHRHEDPKLVFVDGDEPVESLDDWRTVVTSDGPTDRDEGAAVTLRELRDHGES
jgi:hypothetical protein